MEGHKNLYPSIFFREGVSKVMRPLDVPKPDDGLLHVAVFVNDTLDVGGSETAIERGGVCVRLHYHAGQ